MVITLRLSAEQEKALLTQYVTIADYAQRVMENRASDIIEQIVADHSNVLIGVTAKEQAVIDLATAGKIITRADMLPGAVRRIIVQRAPIKTMAEKIAEQEVDILEPVAR